MMWGESFASLGIVPARSKTLVFPASSGSNAGLGQAVFGAELRERLAVAKSTRRLAVRGATIRLPISDIFTCSIQLDDVWQLRLVARATNDFDVAFSG